MQTGRVTLTPEDEISQLLQQTRAVLTKVDDALEYPMTASERRRSDWQVEDARWEVSGGKSRQ